MDFKFTFNLVKSKKVKTNKKINSNICYAISFRDKNDEWKAYVRIKEHDEYKEEIFPFTPESYDLKDKTDIFTINKIDNHFVWVKRSKFDAHNCPTSSTYYTPFCNFNVYKGHLKLIDDKTYFNLEEFIQKFSSVGFEYFQMDNLDKLKPFMK